MCKEANKLKYEKSPYLLQHKDNPVNWYAWGQEAFDKAKKEDKPIFLSIGYATCHWCHVMEHESFEDDEVAKLLNETFISIKVDREERPDIDHIYMTVCQFMTGSGGWPLTIMMTPDKKPFFAATYIPKKSMPGRMGMVDLIGRIKQVWKNDRAKIEKSADRATNALANASNMAKGSALNSNLLALSFKQMSERYDAQHGGFGRSPKFPSPHNLTFLLRYYKRSGNKSALEMVEKTLTEMIKGGIYDHVGFGFHRYSTDQHWLVPHFEKMLYDQALLAIAYLETYQVTGKAHYSTAAEQIFTYVLRDMTDKEGGFYSAEDADSEGEEGKFYVWSEDQIKSVLNKDEFKSIVATYNIAKEGNFVDEVKRRKTGHNIFFLSALLADADKLEPARKKLFAHREKRVHPLKDDKVLTDWNGLMIAALAKGAKILGNENYLAAAKKSADFMLKTMLKDGNRLLHRYREGDAAITGIIDDYSFLAWGLLELYEAGFDAKYLEAAKDLTDSALKHFWDDKNGGFYMTADDAEKLITRSKDIYDGAIPSGNSVAMLNLLRLNKITGKSEYVERAVKLGAAFAQSVNRAPSAHNQLMGALDFYTGPAYEVVIVGDLKSEDTKQMLAKARGRYIPNMVLLHKQNDSDTSLNKLSPYTANMTAIKGKATAYVCKNFTCDLPTNDVEKMLKQLK